jgi:hypothetical protein
MLYLSLRNAMLTPVIKAARIATGFQRKPMPVYIKGTMLVTTLKLNAGRLGNMEILLPYRG